MRGFLPSGDESGICEEINSYAHFVKRWFKGIGNSTFIKCQLIS